MQQHQWMGQIKPPTTTTAPDPSVEIAQIICKAVVSVATAYFTWRFFSGR